MVTSCTEHIFVIYIITPVRYRQHCHRVSDVFRRAKSIQVCVIVMIGAAVNHDVAMVTGAVCLDALDWFLFVLVSVFLSASFYFKKNRA